MGSWAERTLGKAAAGGPSKVAAGGPSKVAAGEVGGPSFTCV